MQEMKECNKCGELKCIADFTIGSNSCKPCVVLRNRDYYRTWEGRIKGMLCQLKSKSKDRNHANLDTTLEDFTAWLCLNKFTDLYSAWVASGYSKGLVPSVDRLDSTKPYEYANMRLITWEENNRAAYTERKAGKRITRQNRQIRQLDIDGVLVNTFVSISLAARELGFCRTNINSCLKGMREIAHGFRWEYQLEQLPNIPTKRDNKRKEK